MNMHFSQFEMNHVMNAKCMHAKKVLKNTCSDPVKEIFVTEAELIIGAFAL